jgi:alpha-mannosidase
VEVEARVFWQQKDRMLKLAVPVDCGGQPVFRGQVAYGVQDLPMNGDEAVAQKWVAVNGDGGTLSLVNDSVYGSDFQDGVLRMTLLRSAAYSGHPIGNKPVVPQGERLYRFWLNAGPTEARMALIENEAQAHHEAPMALSFFPSGHGTAQEPFLTVTDPSIHVAAVKHAESGDGIVVRVYAPSGDGAEGELVFTASGLRIPVSLGAWEIQTVRVDLVAGSYTFTDLLERAVTL